jgi:acyl dehydratase
MDFKVGDKATLSRTITDEDIRDFAEVVGDNNPIHLDESFALKSRFGRRIAHGMWGGALISAVLGTRLPGAGTIFLSQSLKFLSPVFPGDTITAQVTLSNIREDKPILTFETICKNQNNDICIKGEAKVLFEQLNEGK